MKDLALLDSQFQSARNAHDIQGLESLRKAALNGDESALREAAQQFEAIFVQMMLKSMRQAEDVLADEDSPFNSKQVKFYRDMHDQQLATSLSSSGSIGLADIIVKQLSPKTEGYQHASTIRNDANLSDINRARRSETEQVQNTFAPEVPNKANGVTKVSAFASPQEFVETLLPKAEQAAKALGLEPLALVAQAAVETGWGQHMMHKGGSQNAHNLFGIKADQRWQGDTARVDTLEFDQGVAKRQKADFRAYDSFEQSLKDYADFIQNSPRYAKALEHEGSPQAYFQQLQQAGYATDPKYAEKIQAVLNSDTLKPFRAQALGDN